MNYREYPPAPALQGYIECFWTITGQRAAAGPGRVTPDGAVEIVLSFADPMRLGRSGEPLEIQPSRIVIGQLEQSAENQNLGCADYLGIRFRPAGIFAFLPLPQHELTGSIVNLDDLAPALDRESNLPPNGFRRFNKFCRRIAALQPSRISNRRG
jgi:hypothetical protein